MAPPHPHLLPWEVHVTTLGLVTPIFIGRCEEMIKKKSKKETDRWKTQLMSINSSMIVCYESPGGKKVKVFKTQKVKKKKTHPI